MDLKVLVFVSSVLTLILTCGLASDETRQSAIHEKKHTPYCQSQTPCGWKIYNYVDYPEVKLNNDYCTCRPGLQCQSHEIRSTEGYIEYRCKQKRG